MKDAIEIRDFPRNIKKAVLIGGGLVGLEIGGALLMPSVKVSVIEHNPRILPRQMDEDGAKILQKRWKLCDSLFF